MTLVPIGSGRPPARGRPRRDPSWMLNQLPVEMASDPFFARFVGIFQHVGTTILEDADNVENVVDVSVAPLPLVRWLSSWIGMPPLDESLPEDLQRRIVQAAARTLAWRGTAYGISEFLGLVWGADLTVLDGARGQFREGSRRDSSMVVITTTTPVPGPDDDPDAGRLTRGDLVILLRDELPAHVSAELWIDDALVWTTERTPRKELWA